MNEKPQAVKHYTRGVQPFTLPEPHLKKKKCLGPQIIFFSWYRIREEAHEDATSMNLERSLHYRKEG